MSGHLHQRAAFDGRPRACQHLVTRVITCAERVMTRVISRFHGSFARPAAGTPVRPGWAQGPLRARMPRRPPHGDPGAPAGRLARHETHNTNPAPAARVTPALPPRR